MSSLKENFAYSLKNLCSLRVPDSAKTVLEHCSPSDLSLEDASFIPLGRVSPDKQLHGPQSLLADFYDQSMSDFAKSGWKLKLFQTAVRGILNSLLDLEELMRVESVHVSPQNAYHSQNIGLSLDVGNINRLTHLLDTALNSVAQSFRVAKSGEAESVGDGQTVKEALLQTVAAFLHDAAVYVFSHTGEDKLRKSGIPADHDALLVLLVCSLDKQGIFEAVGLTRDEVIGAVFPPHFADGFASGQETKEVKDFIAVMNYWKPTFKHVTDEDLASVIDVATNQNARGAVSRNKWIARYVHNALDNASYSVTDVAHRTEYEMAGLMMCQHGVYTLSASAQLITNQEMRKFPKAMRHRMKPDRSYYVDRKTINHGTNRTFEAIVERRFDNASKSELYIPIYLREVKDPAGSSRQHWRKIDIGKGLLAKFTFLSATWAAKGGEHDVATSSMYAFWRVIKTQFNYARIKVASDLAAMSGGFFEKAIQSKNIPPSDFNTMREDDFIRKHFDARVVDALLGKNPHFYPENALGSGYDLEVMPLISLLARPDIDWFKVRPKSSSLRDLTRKLDSAINEWKTDYQVNGAEMFYAALSPKIEKEFSIKAVGFDIPRFFDFLSRRSHNPIDHEENVFYLKNQQRLQDTFSSRITMDQRLAEGRAESAASLLLEEELMASLVVAIPRAFWKQAMTYAPAADSLVDLKDRLTLIIKDHLFEVENGIPHPGNVPVRDFFRISTSELPHKGNIQDQTAVK